MIITTFYFSGTGNTKWAVDTLNTAIFQKGQRSSVYSIEALPQDLGQLVRRSDIIGVAFPVYAMNIPPIMRQFLARLNETLREADMPKPLFVLTTIGFADGCGPREVSRLLRDGGLSLNNYVSVKIANNVIKPDAKGAAPSPEAMRERLNKGREKITRLAGALISGEKHFDFGPYLFSGLTRKAMYNLVLSAYTHLSIDGERCTRCMLCASGCPSNAIKMDGDGPLTVTSACTGCLRCYNSCSNGAILYNGKNADPAHLYPGPEALAEQAK